MVGDSVVEFVSVVRDHVLVACADGQPVALVLFYSEGHFARTIAFLLQGGLQQTEVITVAFVGFYDLFADYIDSSVLELCAELEIDFSIIEDGRIFSSLLQGC